MIIRIHAYCSAFLKKKYELWRKIQSDLNFAPKKLEKKIQMQYNDTSLSS